MPNIPTARTVPLYGVSPAVGIAGMARAPRSRVRAGRSSMTFAGSIESAQSYSVQQLQADLGLTEARYAARSGGNAADDAARPAHLSQTRTKPAEHATRTIRPPAGLKVLVGAAMASGPARGTAGGTPGLDPCGPRHSACARSGKP